MLIQIYKKAYPWKLFLQVQADVGKIQKDEIDGGKDEELFDNKITQLKSKLKEGEALCPL